MLRVLTILMLIAAGLPQLGIGLADSRGTCGDSVCSQAAVQVSCCGNDSGGDGFCPMSNGPCKCAAAPPPDPQPEPQAPRPRPDRDTVTGVPNGPPPASPVVGPDSNPLMTMPRVITLTAGKSHNEIQALLQTWRT